MENTVNQRIIFLKEKSGLTDAEFCLKGSIAIGTLWNIQNDKNVSSKTIKSIAKGFNVNQDWIKTGQGTMDQEPQNVALDSIYKDALYAELTEKANTWKESAIDWKGKYEDLFLRFNSLLDKMPLGKSKALNYKVAGRVIELSSNEETEKNAA